MGLESGGVSLGWLDRKEGGRQEGSHVEALEMVSVWGVWDCCSDKQHLQYTSDKNHMLHASGVCAASCG